MNTNKRNSHPAGGRERREREREKKKEEEVIIIFYYYLLDRIFQDIDDFLENEFQGGIE